MDVTFGFNYISYKTDRGEFGSIREIYYLSRVKRIKSEIIAKKGSEIRP